MECYCKGEVVISILSISRAVMAQNFMCGRCNSVAKRKQTYLIWVETTGGTFETLWFSWGIILKCIMN